MKKMRLVVTLFALSFLLVGSSLYAKQKSTFDPANPFTGKFKGNVNQSGSLYKVIYNLTNDAEGNITGTADTYLNGQLVLPVTVAGAVNEDNKTADITLSGPEGFQTMLPSIYVRITLTKNGKTGVSMKYLDANSEPFGKKVRYKRVKK